MAPKKIHIRRTHEKYEAGKRYSVPDEISEKLAVGLVKNQKARWVEEKAEKPKKKKAE